MLTQFLVSTAMLVGCVVFHGLGLALLNRAMRSEASIERLLLEAVGGLGIDIDDLASARTPRPTRSPAASRFVQTETSPSANITSAAANSAG